MTDDPIDLDGRRTAARQRESEMRRPPANSTSSIATNEPSALENLEDHMLVHPARSWIEVMEKWRFLINQYAATPEAADEQIKKLIKCALADMERLRKREERE